MLLELISIVIIFIGTVLLFGGVSGDYGMVMSAYLDLPSLTFVLVMCLPILIRNGLWKDFIRGFMLLNKKYSCSLSDMRRTLDAIELMQKQVLYSGVINTCFGAIFVLRMTEDLAYLGPNMSVALIVVLYVAIIELLLLPLQLEAKRRIINYMEEE